jgi:predicted phosphoribosyltransferase
VAVPVAADEAIGALQRVVDEVVVLERAAFFFAVGELYDDFRPVSDEEVVAVLEAAAGPPPAPGSAPSTVRVGRPDREPRPVEV